MSKKLSIIGRGARFLSGVLDGERERWIVSSAFFSKPEICLPCEKVFQLHAPHVWEEKIHLAKGKLVLAWEAHGYEAEERLPYKKLLEEFGPIFPSSISWMLAYALFLGYDDIELHGVDMNVKSEYETQRDHLLYLIGIAHERGVSVKMQEYAGIYLTPESYGVPQ